MKPFKTLFISVTLLALVPFFVVAQERESVWQSLHELDDNFSADSLRQGTSSAFLKYMSENAVVFRQGPVSARRIYENFDPKLAMDSLLESRAHYFDFSRSGDLAVASGPFRDTQGSGEGQIRNHGYYVSVWRMNDQGWRMEADITVGIPGILSLEVEAELESSNLAYLESPDTESIPGNTLADVIATEKEFVEAINFRGGRRAMVGFGLENQRIYVPGMAPAIGTDSGALTYGTFLDDILAMDLLTLDFHGGQIASSGEFAFTYGTMGSEYSRFRTNYLRVWRYTNGSEWKIAIEVLRPY